MRSSENGGARRPKATPAPPSRPKFRALKTSTLSTPAHPPPAAPPVAAATAAAAAEITARTAVTAPAAGRTFFLRTGDVDRQCTTVELRAVHGRDGLLRFLGRGVGDEGETACTT